MVGLLEEHEFRIDGPLTIVNGGETDPDPVGVPEPGTLLLFGAGLVGATLMRRKRAISA